MKELVKREFPLVKMVRINWRWCIGRGERARLSFDLSCFARRELSKNNVLLLFQLVIKLFSEFFIYPLARHMGKVIYYALVRPSGIER